MCCTADSGRLGAMSSDTATPSRVPGNSEPPTARRGRRRSSSTRGQRVGLALVLGAALCVALLATDAEPTGGAVVDALYRCGVMAATTLAGARARRRVLLVAAALVCIGSDGWMLLPAATALVLSFVLALTDRRERVAGGVAGALVGWAALELSWPASPVGATALLAAAALLPLWWSAYRVARTGTRRTIRVMAAVGLAVLVVGAVTGAVLAATERAELVSAAESTVDAARVLADGAGEGDATPFEQNRDRFAAVAHAAGSWWAAPSGLVPGVAQNVRAVRAAAESGAELNGAAAGLATQVDYDSLTRADGSIDVARLAGFARPARDATTAIDRSRTRLAEVESPWLAPPVSDQLEEFQGHLADAAAASQVAAEATVSLPGILGADGPRRYLLLLGNPAEARDLGGHLGNWAELTAIDGKLDVVRVGEPYELFGPASEQRPTVSDGLDLPPSLVEIDPTRFPQNWSASPDLSTVATLAADLYPQAAGGAPIDGVLYADPTAFAALLEITGPVQAAGRTLSADDAVQFLTRDQYAMGSAQEASVTPLVRTALDTFTDRQLPGPVRLSEVFSEAVAGGHLQFVTTVEAERELLGRVGLDQPISASRGGDLVAVVNRNANPSKIDTYLHRTIDYEVDWDPATGRVDSRVVVTLRNDAPADGLPPVVGGSSVANPAGTNRTELSILSPLDAVGARIDGEERSYGSRPDVADLRRYSLVVDLPPGSQRTVILDLTGSVATGTVYRLAWYNQPLPNPDESRLIVDPVGTRLADGSESGSVPIGPRRIERVSVRAES